MGSSKCAPSLTAKHGAGAENSEGSLGNGEQTSDFTLTPVKMKREPGALQGKTDKLVTVGNQTVCVVTTDNNIYCVGQNTRGQLGIGTAGASKLVPQKVQKPASMDGKTVTQIVSGRRFVCAIASGDLYCWGTGTDGQLGDGGTVNKYTPQLNTTIGTNVGKPVTDINSDSSSYHICAVASSKAYCWGHNLMGQLGDGTATERLVPTPVNTGASAP